MQVTEADLRQALQSVFKDCMDWGRSYGTRLNLSDITREDVSLGFTDKAIEAIKAQIHSSEGEIKSSDVQSLAPAHNGDMAPITA